MVAEKNIENKDRGWVKELRRVRFFFGRGVLIVMEVLFIDMEIVVVVVVVVDIDIVVVVIEIDFFDLELFEIELANLLDLVSLPFRDSLIVVHFPLLLLCPLFGTCVQGTNKREAEGQRFYCDGDVPGYSLPWVMPTLVIKLKLK